MPAVLLPLVPNAAARIEGEAEQLAAWLAPPGDPRMTARIGTERTERREGSIEVLCGERYRTGRGWVQGMRYLQWGERGVPVAVLNLTLVHERRTSVVASNVYVDPAHRRQGRASELLRAALRDHPRLCADASMTEAGAALVGHSPASARRPRP